MRILESRWFLVDVVEGFVVIFVRFVLLLGEFLHSSVPLSLYFVEGLVDFSFDLSLFASVVVLLFAFSFIFGDSSIGRGRSGWQSKGGDGFLCFESSLIGDSDW